MSDSFFDLRAHFATHGDDLKAAADNLRQGLTIEGRDLNGILLDAPWTTTRLKALRKFLRCHRLNWRWIDYNVMQITDPLTGQIVTAANYDQLGPALTSLRNNRLDALSWGNEHEVAA